MTSTPTQRVVARFKVADLQKKRLDAAKRFLQRSRVDPTTLETIATTVVGAIEAGDPFPIVLKTLRKKGVDTQAMHNNIVGAHRAAEKAGRPKKPRKRKPRGNPNKRFTLKIKQQGSGSWAAMRYSPTLKGALKETRDPDIRDTVWAVFDGRTKVVDSRGWSGDIDFEARNYQQ